METISKTHGLTSPDKVGRCRREDVKKGGKSWWSWSRASALPTLLKKLT
jgi:hypothetical protein